MQNDSDAARIQKVFPTETLLVFLKPQDIKVLEERLLKRSSESEAEIKKRMDRAIMEMQMLDKFDYVVSNIVLNDTLKEVEEIVEKNIK